MRRRTQNIPWLLLAMAVGVTALFLIVRQRAPFGKNNSSFSVDEKINISRIVLYEKGRRLVLEKNEDDWTVDGKTGARPGAVSFMLLLLREMQIKSPVGPELFSEVVKEKTEPVKVHVYSGWRLRKSFFVYRTSANAYGNIMKMRVASRPFIMYVPGLEEDIGSVFNADPLFWQPFVVFGIMPSEIRSVEVLHPGDTTTSFKISYDNRMIKFESNFAATITGVDTAKVRRYLSYFSYVPFENWEKELSGEEILAVLTSEPLCIITAAKNDGTYRTLTVWQKYTLDAEGGRITDTYRAWGKIDDLDGLVILRYFDLDPVLRDARYFLKD